MLTIFMLASMLYNITQESVIRFIVFAVFTSANLFILPQIIDFEDFVVVFGRVTALLVVIGFLPILAFPLPLAHLT